MALNIGRVDAQVNITPSPTGAQQPGAPDIPGDTAATAAAAPDELLGRIRPIVIEILEQELSRFQRQQG